jgi:hypothetical protein
MRRQQTKSKHVPTMSMDLNLSVGTDCSHGEYDSQSSDKSILTREPVDGSSIAWELHGCNNDRMEDNNLPIKANKKEKEVESTRIAPCLTSLLLLPEKPIDLLVVVT